MSGVRNPLLASALWYARQGIFVLPLKPRSKEPITKGGVYDATTDPAVITQYWTQWPDANIGGAGGYGKVFVDCDKKGKRNGLVWLKEQHEAGIIDVEHMPVAATPHGGRHLLFDVPLGEDIGNSIDAVASGVEVRSMGYYVVLPPSVLDDGAYTWMVSPRDAAIPELPPELVETFTKAAQPERRPVLTSTNNFPDYPNIQPADMDRVGRRLVDDAVARVGRMGGRNNAGHWLGQQLYYCRYDTMSAEHYQQLYQQRVQHDGPHEYTWAESLKSLQQAFKEQQREPHPYMKALTDPKSAPRQAAPAPATEPAAPVEEDESGLLGLELEPELEETEPAAAQTAAPASEDEITIPTEDTAGLLAAMEGLLSESAAALAEAQRALEAKDEALATLQYQLAQERLNQGNAGATLQQKNEEIARLREEYEREHTIRVRRDGDFDWAVGLLGMANVNPAILRTLFFLYFQVKGEAIDNGIDLKKTPVRVNIAALALDSGQNAATVGRHIKQAQELGLLAGRTAKRILAENGQPTTRVTVRVGTDFLEKPRKLEPTEKKNWGGRRTPRCPNPSCHGIKLRATGYVCMDCGTEWSPDEETLTELDKHEHDRAPRSKRKPRLDMAAGLKQPTAPAAPPAVVEEEEEPELALGADDMLYADAAGILLDADFDPTVEQDDDLDRVVMQDQQGYVVSIPSQDEVLAADAAALGLAGGATVEQDDDLDEAGLLALDGMIELDETGLAYIKTGELWPGAETRRYIARSAVLET